MDEHLPDGSGMELCREVTERNPGASVIIVSGDSYITIDDAIKAGAKTLLAKGTVDYIEMLQLFANQYVAAARA
jgi:DNA-binding NarL/FixJ family response regulator